MRRPCGLRGHRSTVRPSPRAVVTITTAPPPWPCGHHRDALAMVRLSPPSRRRQQRDATITTRPAPRYRTGRCAMAHPAPVRRAGGGGPMGDACVAPTASCHIVPATWRSRASAARPSPPRRCRLQRGATTVAMRRATRRHCAHQAFVASELTPPPRREGTPCIVPYPAPHPSIVHPPSSCHARHHCLVLVRTYGREPRLRCTQAQSGQVRCGGNP